MKTKVPYLQLMPKFEKQKKEIEQKEVPLITTDYFLNYMCEVLPQRMMHTDEVYSTIYKELLNYNIVKDYNDCLHWFFVNQIKVRKFINSLGFVAIDKGGGAND